jgi:tripartite-type tricarboxylate transporter receptor subunit TctC
MQHHPRPIGRACGPATRRVDRSTAKLATVAGAVLAIVLGTAIPSDARAQAWPSKPLKLVVPFPAGAATDFIGRTVGAKVAELIGQPIVVENRAGAGGTIGADAVAKSPADGYTLLLGEPGGMAINVSMLKDPPYHPVRDFVAVGQVVQLPLLLVAPPALGAKSIGELLAMKGRDLTFGSAGNGSIQHLAMEQFKAATGMTLTHAPYKGGGPALTDLVAGRIDLLVLTIPTAQPQLKAGKAVPIAMFSERRSPLLPDVPTVVEAGYRQLAFATWQGFFAPAGTPREIVQRLNAEIGRAIAAPDVREKLTAAGAEVVGGSPDDFARIVRDDVERWGKVVRAAGIRGE